MMKILVTVLAIVFVASEAVARTPRVKLNVENVGVLYGVEGATLSAGSAKGKIKIQFSKTHGNRCVAGGSKITPLVSDQSTYDEKGETEKRYLFLALKYENDAICPMIYQPTPVNYTFEIEDLDPGESYEVHFLGASDKDGEPYRVLTVKAK